MINFDFIERKDSITSAAAYPSAAVAELGEISVGEVKLFTYPNPEDHCILIRTAAEEYVAYSQECMHLSCAVYYSQESNCVECPCHCDFFRWRTAKCWKVRHRVPCREYCCKDKVINWWE